MNYHRRLYFYLAKLLLLMQVYLKPSMLKVMGLGFSCALPVSLVFSVIITYLSDSKIDLKTVGLFSAICFPFTFKFLWAPLLDILSIPYLTKRFRAQKKLDIAFAKRVDYINIQFGEN